MDRNTVLNKELVKKRSKKCYRNYTRTTQVHDLYGPLDLDDVRNATENKNMPIALAIALIPAITIYIPVLVSAELGFRWQYSLASMDVLSFFYRIAQISNCKWNGTRAFGVNIYIDLGASRQAVTVNCLCYVGTVIA